MTTLEDLHILMEDARDFAVVNQRQLLNTNPQLYFEGVGEHVEQFFQRFEAWRDERASTAETYLGDTIAHELTLMTDIWEEIMSEHELKGYAGHIERLEGHMYTISRTIGEALEKEEQQTERNILNHTESDNEALIKPLEDFTFPRDLFSEERFSTEGLALSGNDNVEVTSYLDGVVGISMEGHLDMMTNVPGTIVWRKNSVACWATESELKGLNVPLFKRGLPLFRIGQVHNLNLWATFVPDNISPEEDEIFNLKRCKELYNQVFDEILHNAIKKMPYSTSTRIRNCTNSLVKTVRFHLPGHELDVFSTFLEAEIVDARQNGIFPPFLTFNFISMAFGQDTPLTDTIVQTINNTMAIENMRDVVVHLATNFYVQGKSIFWSKDLCEKLFKSSGAVYQSCGFYSLANGAGNLGNNYRQSASLGHEVVYMKLYNTIFKKIRRMTQDFHHGYSDELLFEQPCFSNVLSYQPFGLPHACKKNLNLRKMKTDMERGIPLTVLEERLHVLPFLDHLHSARIEFICCLKSVSSADCKERYTGHSTLTILEKLSKEAGLLSGPMVALPREGISTYLTGMMSSLLVPIKHAFQQFFVENRPVGPDVLETIHVCECLISFILYGTKNYFPKLVNIGLTLQRFKSINRITLFFTAMKTKTTVFKIDATANSAGTVYSIKRPIIQRKSDEDSFSNELLLINKHLRLNRYNVAEILISSILQIVASSKYKELNAIPTSIFGAPFVRANFTVVRRRITVSAAVRFLLDLNFSDNITNVIETAVETVGDLSVDLVEDDLPMRGKEQLHQALMTLIYLILKKKILLDLRYIPILSFRYFAPIVPDLRKVFIEGNPPIFDPYLTHIVLYNAYNLLGQNNPFPNALPIPDVPTMFLLYTVSNANVEDVTLALTMLGVALVLLSRGHSSSLYWFLKKNKLTLQQLNDIGLCKRDYHSHHLYEAVRNTEFKFVVRNVLSTEEKAFITAHNNLSGSGFNKFKAI